MIERQERFVIHRVGRFAELAPVEAVDPDAVRELMQQSAAEPVMSYGAESAPGTASFPGSAAIIARESGRCVGLLGACWLWESEEIVELSVFTDRRQCRAGVGAEAVYLFCEELFGRGVRRVNMRVLAINRPVLRLMRSAGKSPDVHLRESRFLGGRFIDEFVFSWSPADFGRMLRARPRLGLVAHHGRDGRRPGMEAVRQIQPLQV